MSDEYEMVALMRVLGCSGWCAYPLATEVSIREMMREAIEMVELSYADGEFNEDGDEALVTLTVEKRPRGWLDSLPEFEGF